MSKEIKKLLISQAVANLADVFLRVVIIANVFIISGSVIATSMVPILIGLASFSASFLVPLVTKKVALNRVLSLTQLGKTVLLFVLLLLLYCSETVHVSMLYIFIVSISLLDGFAAPVSYAIVPQYATDLGRANAALSMSGEGVQLVGWGLGGLLYAALGIQLSSVVVLLLFTVATILMFTLAPVKIKTLAAETNLETVIKGWRLVVTKQPLRFLVTANLLEIIANTIWVSSVILVFVTEYLHQTESYWGYANTAYSIGILLGGAIVFRLSERFLQSKWQSIFFSLIFMTIITTVIILYAEAITFLLLSLAIGVFCQIKEVPESVFLQETVAETELVNVYAVFEVVSAAAFSCFVFLVSLITDSFGVLYAFWLAVICLLAESFLVFINRKQLQ